MLFVLFMLIVVITMCRWRCSQSVVENRAGVGVHVDHSAVEGDFVSRRSFKEHQFRLANQRCTVGHALSDAGRLRGRDGELRRRRLRVCGGGVAHGGIGRLGLRLGLCRLDGCQLFRHLLRHLFGLSLCRLGLLGDVRQFLLLGVGGLQLPVGFIQQLAVLGFTLLDDGFDRRHERLLDGGSDLSVRINGDVHGLWLLHRHVSRGNVLHHGRLRGGLLIVVHRTDQRPGNDQNE